MLSLGKLAGGKCEYYLQRSSTEDYRLAGSEPPGHWWERGAQLDFGLSGEVKAEDLRPLFHGFAPDGTPLVQNAGDEGRRAGFDATFSAPKSVSTCWAASSPEIRGGIEAAHAEAVRAGLKYLEDNAAYSRRGRGGAEREKVALAAAIFEHGTSREGDPNLHSHCLILNVARRADGTCGTIDSEAIFDHKMAAGAVYRTELARQLEERLGLVCEREKSWFEVAGVPESLQEEFSKRRSQIEEALAARGLESAAAASAAALATRQAKAEPCPRAELFASWQKTAEAHGFTPQAVNELLRRQAPRQDVSRRLDACIDEALRKITASRSHFAEHDLVRHTAEAAQDQALGAELVLHGVRQKLEHSPEVVRLGGVRGDVRYATRETLETEHRLMEAVDRSRGAGGHAVSGDILREVFKARPTITGEQKLAVEFITQAKDSIATVVGMAGTGEDLHAQRGRRGLPECRLRRHRRGAFGEGGRGPPGRRRD